MDDKLTSAEPKLSGRASPISSETTTGFLTVVAALSIAVWLLYHLYADVRNFGSYVVYADFATVAGLKLGDPVKIAGVKVGTVESIQLNLKAYEARVGIRINRQITLHEDALAAVDTRSLLIGAKFIAIDPGNSIHRLQPGETIAITRSAFNLTDRISQLMTGKLDLGI